MEDPLPSGHLAPARCAHSTLYVLLGDSIDREVVRSRCANPVAYIPQTCAKCVLCNAESGCDSYVNIMLFGLGLFGCDHVDRHWAPHEETQVPQPRIRALLTNVLNTPAATTYSRIVISLHSGGWDVLATKECANISSVLLNAPNTWLAVAETALLRTATSVVVSSQVASRVRTPLLWRTVPLLCRSFGGGEDASELIAAVSSHGVSLACRHSMTLVDWRGLSCARLNTSLQLPDGTHWHSAAYDLMAEELVRVAAAGHSHGVSACGVPTPRCECDLCNKFAAWSWRLGRKSAAGCSPHRDKHSASDGRRAQSTGTPSSLAAPLAAVADAAAPAGRAAAPFAELAAAASARPTCTVGSRPPQPASIALFSLAAYPSLSTPGWLAMSALGWHANAPLLHLHVLAESRVPAAWAPADSNVITLLFSAPLLYSLQRFVGVTAPSNRTRAASYAPLLAHFSEVACGLDLAAYTFFGSVELDVLLGDLAPFVTPYMAPPPAAQYDAIALRWAPPNRKGWVSIDDALAYNTLADADAGVPLSTPLLLLRNNASMRRLWWRAERWLRTQERPGAYSLHRAATCRTCTGPTYWFDEHNFPNFWRSELGGHVGSSIGSSSGGSGSGGSGSGGSGGGGGGVRVVFVCCAFDDHHVGVGSTTIAPGGCTVEWTRGVLTRTCPSAAKAAWDDGLTLPPPAVRGARGCEVQDVAWPEAARWAMGDDACARLPRHAASEAAASVCAAPAASYGYDVAWHGDTRTRPNALLTVAVVGGGDSAAALLAATGGRCHGVPIKRTLAAFHAARSKHVPGQHAVPRADATWQLFPRFLKQV